MKAAFSFVRMNPMTTAHMMLIEEMCNIPCDKAVLYLSHKQDKLNKKDPLKNKNPLSYQDKLCYVKTFIKEAGLDSKIEIVDSDAITFFDGLHDLNKKFNEVIIVGGPDRIDDKKYEAAKEFKKRVKEYNGKYSSQNPNELIYKFDSIEYYQVGENRDPDAEGAEGMSASKLRKLACEGNYEEFKEGIPSYSEDIIQELYDKIRKAMLG